ncbi:MAG: tyrosine-type recombinase/integrase [Eubacterium sp.]|nr:tyrosine-type recombinase/integrase [Eubacterium sp.]MBR7061171.1 tyrosine-type recombinase/integrase [Eubacterium sp.]
MRREEFSLLPPLVQDYLIYIEAIKGHSELSVLEYASDLRTFFRYIAKQKRLSPADDIDEINDLTNIDINVINSITLNDAYQFLIYCKNERRNNEATRARRVIAIRRFFAYLTDNLGLLKVNPMKNLDTPKIKKSLPKYLTLEEAQRLLSVIDGKFKERDFAIITLFLNCGMRLAELVSIDYSDIKSDNTIVITGKGNKERTIYLNKACIEAVSAYMKVRPNDGVRDRALFLSSRNQRISPRMVEIMVNNYLEKAGLGGRGLSVHKLRHTAATLMYQHGNVDLLLLKEILGHENLGTTEIYTHISSDATKNAIDSNPLSGVSNNED